MAKFVNGWNASSKQSDKLDITLRFGILTIFEWKIDTGDKTWSFKIFNFGFNKD